jgi:hypothetical protein
LQRQELGAQFAILTNNEWLAWLVRTMRLLHVLFTALLLPAIAAAQPIARVQQDAAAQAQSAMPLWGTSDGRILAMVAFTNTNNGAPVLPQAPQIGSATDWQLIDITNFVNGGLSLRLGNNVSTYANFGRGIVLAPLNSAAVSVGCDSTFAFTLEALCPARRAVSSSGDLRVGTDVNIGNFDLDLNYGLAWLRNEAPLHIDGTTPPPDLFAGIGNPALPTLVIPNLPITGVLSSGVGAEGRWQWDDAQSLDLGAALSRLQLEVPGNPLAPIFNQAALTFGVHHGDFSGVIVGRVLGPADALANGQHWSSVDLGISWRAPWRGVFSIGAQNLWSSGAPPLSESTHEIDPAQARVPYVQYHQDL